MPTSKKKSKKSLNIDSHCDTSADKSDVERSDSVSVIQYSPVKSPSPNINIYRHNLSGSERSIKDSAADLHNAIEKWDVLSSSGMNLAQEIANIKLAAVFERSQNEGNDVNGIAIPEQLEGICEKLSETLKKMARQVDKMCKVVSTLNGVLNLENHTKSEEEQGPLFQTWPTARFASTAKAICDMYKQELEVRKKIVENIAHCNDRQTMMFYTATWLHSPYIGSLKDELLHGLLLETGHLKQ